MPALHIARYDIACCFERKRRVQYLRSQETTMPLVGAVAAPHSHLQLFTRPAENEQYKADVQKGRDAMIALRAQVERADADTILVIHDDHFVNFDFRCYPPFALFVGQEAKGSGVTDPDEIKKIHAATN